MGVGCVGGVRKEDTTKKSTTPVLRRAVLTTSSAIVVWRADDWSETHMTSSGDVGVLKKKEEKRYRRGLEARRQARFGDLLLCRQAKNLAAVAGKVLSWWGRQYIRMQSDPVSKPILCVSVHPPGSGARWHRPASGAPPWHRAPSRRTQPPSTAVPVIAAEKW